MVVTITWMSDGAFFPFDIYLNWFSPNKSQILKPETYTKKATRSDAQSVVQGRHHSFACGDIRNANSWDLASNLCLACPPGILAPHSHVRTSGPYNPCNAISKRDVGVPNVFLKDIRIKLIY